MKLGRVVRTGLLTTALLGSTWAGAVNSTDTVNILAPDRSCGTYLTGDPVTRLVAVTWVEGYLSGSAAASGVDILASIDDGAVKVSLQNFCKAHPLDKPTDAALALAKELTERYVSSHKSK